MGQEDTQSMGAPHSGDREAYLPTDVVQDAESPKSRSSQQGEDGEGDDGFDLLKPGAEPIDETPEKMPRANPTPNMEQPDEDSDSDSVKHPDQETSSQVEVNKHVVSTQVPRMKVLDSNPSFKTMVSVPCNIETSPPKFEKSNMYTSLDGETREDLWKVLPKENPGTGKVLTTPTRRKGLNNFSGTTTAARAPARSTPSTPEQMRLARSYEASPNLYLNLNGNPGEQWKQPSENPGQGKATAITPRRKPSSNMNSSSAASGRGAPHSGASTPDQQQERLARSYAENPIEKYTGGRSRRREDQPSRVFSTTQSPRSSMNSHRSRSPVPNHWQDHHHHNNNMMSSGSGAAMGSDFDPMARSPRYITPTIAASLKTVKAPVKSIQFPSTTFGTTTLDRDPVRRGPNARDTQLLRQSKEDSSSSTGKGYPSLKVRTAPTPTQASSFTFRCEERAERRREYYTQLEERVKQKEAERKQMEARTLEEKESQLRELRKSLTYKANPVPRFYQEPVPPPPEIRKPPPTRAKSPNFTPSRRRDSLSFGDQHHVPMAPTPPPTPTPIAIPIPHSSARSSNRRLTIDTNILSYHEKVAQSSSQSKVRQATAAGVDQQSTRRISSVKKPNLVQKPDLAPLRKSVTRDRSKGREITREKHSHQQQQGSMEGPIKAFPRAEASEYFDDFEAMQRYLEEEEMMNANARSRTVSENGIMDADGVGEYGKYIVQHELLSPGSHQGSEKGKVWSPEELAKMHLRRNSPNQSANYASVKDIVLEFSRRLGTSSSSSPP